MQTTGLVTKLKSFGLKEKEAKVYLASLFLGPTSAQKIAEQAAVNRATTYVVIEQLIKLGLMSQTDEAKRTVFTAEEPAALEQLLHLRQRELTTKERELKAFLPLLNEISRTDKTTAPTVKFYKGTEGIISALNYALRNSQPDSEILGISNYDKASQYFSNRVFKSNPKRLKKNISHRLIYSSSTKSYPSKKETKLQTYQIDTPLKADITIYDNFVCLVTYQENEPVGILIEHPDIASLMHQLFDMLWQQQ